MSAGEGDLGCRRSLRQRPVNEVFRQQSGGRLEMNACLVKLTTLRPDLRQRGLQPGHRRPAHADLAARDHVTELRHAGRITVESVADKRGRGDFMGP